MKKKFEFFLFFVVCIGVICSAVLFNTLNAATECDICYVTPDGSSENTGTSFDDSLDIVTAIENATEGQIILLKGGTYNIEYVEDEKNTINLSQSGSEGNEIVIKTYKNKRAVIDFSFPELEWVQNSYGFYITGDYWNISGIDITHAGYQGAYVTGAYNVFENCNFYDNRNTGLEINKGGSYTTVINCDAYQNYDPKKLGTMADGFGPKQTMGPGNVFIGCRAWENSDDGFDCYDSPEDVVFEECWAFRNGVNVWGYDDFDTNANGFKIGGNYAEANHILTNCVVFDQPSKGFDQNNNTGGLTLYNCLAYSNGVNFSLSNDLNDGQENDLKNCVSLDGENSDDITESEESNNTWNTGFSVSDDDFRSLDLDLAEVERKRNGELPYTDLFRLSEDSSLIDAGFDVGLEYLGDAPDIGAFELK
jgi:hypothetical protein